MRHLTDLAKLISGHCVLFQTVSLQFVTFDLDCDHSSVDIYNGDNSTAPRIVGSWCGFSPPSDFISTGNTLFVTFQTSGFGRQSNFWAKYTETVKGN